jgi:homoserine dehydrogenase
MSALPAPVRERPLGVAVLGAGTVGREVIRALLELDRQPADSPEALALVGVAVRDLERARAFGLPDELLTDAPAHLVALPEADVVVELMGGDEPARTLILAALGAGKAVVTANKHVLAHHGPDIERTARSAGSAIRFEAAVGGGIPVLGPLAHDLAGNTVHRVRGIVNGTTNYILTAMAEGAGTYEAVLRDAQQRGYAEADPSGDVEGRDAVNKLVILARLAFGRWLDPATVGDRAPSLRGRAGPGITAVTRAELEGAAGLGLTLKLLATASVGADGRVLASVVPTAVPGDSALGRTAGVRNRLEVSATPVGEVGFDGPGAGGPATSSAVLGDILAIARGEGSTWAGQPATEAGAGGAYGPEGAVSVAGRWFAVLPGLGAKSRLPDGIEAHTLVGGGVAIRTTWLDLDGLRRRLLERSPRSLDATCYPIAD